MAVTKQKSGSVSQIREKTNEKKDERVVRTRQRLDAAFVELLGRRAYGNIRVSDITKKARVGRATFYAHYCSKDELLRSQFERIVAPMLAIKKDDPGLIDVSGLLSHVQTAPRLFKALVVGPETGSGPRVLLGCFERRVGQALEMRAGDSREHSRDGFTGSENFAMRRAIVTRAIASSLLAVIECWMETSMSQPAEEVKAICSRLVAGALSTLSAAAGRNADPSLREG
jgi:AcrR family transcriptional regulator